MGIRPVVLVTALLMAAFGLATGVVAAQELSPRTGYTPGCAERSDDAERECRVDLGRSISPFGVGSAAASVLMIAGALGLLTGRRATWRFAVVVATSLFALLAAIAVLSFFAGQSERIGAVAIALLVLPPMLLILALLYFARPRRAT